MNFKFFLTVFSVAFLIFAGFVSWTAYGYYQVIHSDDPLTPRLNVSLWQAKIIRWETVYELIKDETYNLENGDIVETMDTSRATISWPDHSITRLWENTRIIIERMYANEDYSTIEVSYALKKWKVWNTVLRTLFGDSFFEVKLPKDDIVVGVRGTTFEVNLEKRYIHSISHMSTLWDRWWNRVQLFAGEIVSSENILTKLTKEWLDSTWTNWNILEDAARAKIRELEIQKRMDMLSGSGNTLFQGVTRKIISHTKTFQDLEIAKLIRDKDLAWLQKYSTETILSYYQRIPNLTNPEERERIRYYLMTTDLSTKLRESLRVNAFWESLDTGKLTDTAWKYLQDQWVNIQEIKTKLESEAKGQIQDFAKSFSGLNLRGGF